MGFRVWGLGELAFGVHVGAAQPQPGVGLGVHRATPLIRNSAHLGPYSGTAQPQPGVGLGGYRATSLVSISAPLVSYSKTMPEYLAHKKRKNLLGPYSRTMPRAVWWSQGGGCLF